MLCGWCACAYVFGVTETRDSPSVFLKHQPTPLPLLLSDLNARTECVGCEAGTYQDLAGQASCHACDTCLPGFLETQPCTNTTNAQCKGE